ncbi:MAG: T9SS type A sorting domain-containing protein, partial [Bacteroidota bacterium]
GYSSDGESDLVALRKKISPILERYGVDVVLSGHSHVYERSFLIKDHTSFATSFTAANMASNSSGRYDGTAGNIASSDFNAANSSCPYFTIDSVYKHGTVYVVAGSAGQIGGGTNSKFPAFYYKNYSGSSGGESGSMYLEIQDNRLDAKMSGANGTHDQFTIMKGVNKKTVVATTINTATTLNASWIGGYNWYAEPAPPIISQGTGRTLAITPAATGNFTYYVNDSLAPKTTCIADTFLLQVTSALAVSVINYKAFLKNKKAFVQWTTTQEINSDYFTIERSANGRDYEIIMVMDGKGNSSTPTNYEFIDNNPLPGVSYYRLIATDKNGDKKIAGIKSINNSEYKSLGMTIQPNPAINNEVNMAIQSGKKQTVKIKVYSTGGAEVYSNQVQAQQGATTLRFHLAGGAYIVSADTQDGVKVNEKILVK